MYPGRKILFLAALICLYLLPSASGRAQSYASVPEIAAAGSITSESLRTGVEFLAGDLCAGRGTMQKGGSEAALWIERQFESTGLMRMNGSFSQAFYNRSQMCRNIVGMIPSRTLPRGRGRYIIIMSHYDNLGVLAGKTYPGADSNASGVAVMTSLAKAFKQLSDNGGGLQQNIIFVALDGKQLSLAGAQDLWSRLALGRLRDPRNGLPISPSDISMVVNLDILGGTSSPLTKGRDDYLMLLGGGRYNDFLKSINVRNNINLEIGLDYYGSDGFTDLFLNRASDQKVFREKRIYAVMFTSGITMDTNKVSDTADKLDYKVMEKRARLIFHWIERMTYLNK